MATRSIPEGTTPWDQIALPWWQADEDRIIALQGQLQPYISWAQTGVGQTAASGGSVVQTVGTVTPPLSGVLSIEWDWCAAVSSNNLQFLGSVYLTANGNNAGNASQTSFNELYPAGGGQAIRHHSWSQFAVSAGTQYTIVAHHDSSNNNGAQPFGNVSARAILIPSTNLMPN